MWVGRGIGAGGGAANIGRARHPLGPRTARLLCRRRRRIGWRLGLPRTALLALATRHRDGLRRLAASLARLQESDGRAALAPDAHGDPAGGARSGDRAELGLPAAADERDDHPAAAAAVERQRSAARAWRSRSISFFGRSRKTWAIAPSPSSSQAAAATGRAAFRKSARRAARVLRKPRHRAVQRDAA